MQEHAQDGDWLDISFMAISMGVGIATENLLGVMPSAMLCLESMTN